jgi:DNA replication and repair protein RecF
MILSELKIHNVRNIESAHLTLNPRFNFIVGPNGSGKTSLLEALYVLSCGHSFRSRETTSIISENSDSLTVFASTYPLGALSIQKSRVQPTRIQINHQVCHSTSQLAYALPAHIIYSDIFQIIDAGPSIRRSVLDWGLFHVKHEYLGLLKDCKNIIKQRGALLRQGKPYSEFLPWDIQLAQLATAIDRLRQEYFTLWALAFKQVLPLLTDVSCTIQYYKGWDKKNTGKPLEEILVEQFESDKTRGYTQYGPHQADIFIESSFLKAKQHLSRGQQKMILIALKMAQCELLEKPCLSLFDDVTAELDETHVLNLLKFLSQRPGQFVFTAIQLNDALQTQFSSLSTIYPINQGVLQSKS